jgi:Phospholipase_D-nuclease N-terminal
MARRSWSELRPSTRAVVVIGGAAEVVLTTVALRDLRRRPSAGVRGPKWLWAAIALVQPVGPISYLALGRRRR